jgi:hypothetical protein
MKKYLIFGVLILLTVAVTLPVWSSGRAEKADGPQDLVYVIRNQDGQHEQELGSKSGRAYRGLTRAVNRARFMESGHSSGKPSDDVDDINGKPKKKK